MTASTRTRRAAAMMPGMAPFLQHPMRLTAAGTFGTVDDSDDEYLDQNVRVIEATRFGERPMVPGFGVPHAAFGSIREADVQAVLDQFGPAGISVDSIDVTYLTPQSATATVTWSRSDI